MSPSIAIIRNSGLVRYHSGGLDAAPPKLGLTATSVRYRDAELVLPDRTWRSGAAWRTRPEPKSDLNLARPPPLTPSHEYEGERDQHSAGNNDDRVSRPRAHLDAIQSPAKERTTERAIEQCGCAKWLVADGGVGWTRMPNAWCRVRCRQN